MIYLNLELIAAMDLNRGLGYQNKLPWRIDEDLIFFKKKTINKTVVMGRKTAESIKNYCGEALLPQRKNIVLSSKAWPYHNNFTIITYHNYLSVLELAHNNPQESIIIIGGSTVYSLFIEHCRCLWITQINKTYTVDRFMVKFEDKFNLYDETIDYSYQEGCIIRFQYWINNKNS